jgi:hypothetical protein
MFSQVLETFHELFQDDPAAITICGPCRKWQLLQTILLHSCKYNANLLVTCYYWSKKGQTETTSNAQWTGTPVISCMTMAQPSSNL